MSWKKNFSDFDSVGLMVKWADENVIAAGFLLLCL